MANLIQLSEYKVYEKMTSTQDDTLLNALISSVSQLVKTYCGNTFVDFYTNAKTEYISFSQPGCSYLRLKETPVNQITSVEERSSPTQNYSSITEYEVTEDDLLYRVGGYWPQGPKSVKVIYKAGYQTLPEDLKLAVFDLVTYYYKDEYKERRTIGASSIENNTKPVIANVVSWPEHIRRVLNLYKDG